MHKRDYWLNVIKPYYDQYGLKKTLEHFSIQNLNYQIIGKRQKPIPTPEEICNFQKKASTIKRLLIKYGYWEEKCQVDTCIVTNEWNGKPIVLQIDHIDGDCKNNRYENLRLICPNCHTQTDTYGFKRAISYKSGILGSEPSGRGAVP